MKKNFILVVIYLMTCEYIIAQEYPSFGKEKSNKIKTSLTIMKKEGALLRERNGNQ